MPYLTAHHQVLTKKLTSLFQLLTLLKCWNLIDDKGIFLFLLIKITTWRLILESSPVSYFLTGVKNTFKI